MKFDKFIITFDLHFTIAHACAYIAHAKSKIIMMSFKDNRLAFSILSIHLY